MTITLLAFYLFSITAVMSALFVVVARNPVHSVLWLILTFFSAASLFVLMGAEFVAMLLAIVYVGAVAVLFLFVVMMLDVDFVELKSGHAKIFLNWLVNRSYSFDGTRACYQSLESSS
jgi:NADH-quinone oxidoreductase subunit J